jgi:hypothetical protein
MNRKHSSLPLIIILMAFARPRLVKVKQSSTKPGATVSLPVNTNPDVSGVAFLLGFCRPY